jgi:hypothetical protein
MRWGRFRHAMPHIHVRIETVARLCQVIVLRGVRRGHIFVLGGAESAVQERKRNGKFPLTVFKWSSI